MKRLAMSVSEMAEALSISKSMAYALIKFPGFPVVRMGKRVVIPIEALEQWISNGGTGSNRTIAESRKDGKED